MSRGGLVETDALVTALTQSRLAGACIVDPEPLPAGHPLWNLPNALLTSHSANNLEVCGQADGKHGAYARLVEKICGGMSRDGN